MLQELLRNKKTKTILLVSWVLALAFLIVGIVVAATEGGGRAYDGKVLEIQQSIPKTAYEASAMFSFTPQFSGFYTIKSEAENSYNLYVLNENSRKEIEEKDYVKNSFFWGGSSTTEVYLSRGETYYVFIESTGNDRLTVTITQ